MITVYYRYEDRHLSNKLLARVMPAIIQPGPATSVERSHHDDAQSIWIADRKRKRKSLQAQVAG